MADTCIATPTHAHGGGASPTGETTPGQTPSSSSYSSNAVFPLVSPGAGGGIGPASPLLSPSSRRGVVVAGGRAEERRSESPPLDEGATTDVALR